MSLHPGTASYNPAGNSDFTRKAEALALGITRNWSTPKATDGAKGGPGQAYGSGGMPPLPAQAAQWPTPAAQNWKGSSEASVTRADGKSRMDILHYRAEQGFTRPAPAITMDGARPSRHAPISRPLWDSMIASHGRVVSRRILKGRSRRRLLGNGVHPLAAAHAWRSLAAAHGLGPMDLAADGPGPSPSADGFP